MRFQSFEQWKRGWKLDENKKALLNARLLVEKMGLEPTTPWLPAKCSSQLSYIPGLVKDNGLNWFGLCKLSECGFDHKLTLSLITVNRMASLCAQVWFFVRTLHTFVRASWSHSDFLEVDKRTTRCARWFDSSLSHPLSLWFLWDYCMSPADRRAMDKSTTRCARWCCEFLCWILKSRSARWFYKTPSGSYICWNWCWDWITTPSGSNIGFMELIKILLAALVGAVNFFAGFWRVAPLVGFTRPHRGHISVEIDVEIGSRPHRGRTLVSWSWLRYYSLRSLEILLATLTGLILRSRTRSHSDSSGIIAWAQPIDVQWIKALLAALVGAFLVQLLTQAPASLGSRLN